MIIEFTSRWPFIRRHQCSVPPTVPAVVPVVSAVPTGHVSWVRLPDGSTGWLHHHESSGWVVQLQDGTHVQTNQFVNIEAPR